MIIQQELFLKWDEICGFGVQFFQLFITSFSKYLESLILVPCLTLCYTCGLWQAGSCGSNSDLKQPSGKHRNECIPISEPLYLELPKQTALKLEMCLPWPFSLAGQPWPHGIETMHLKHHRHYKGLKTKYGEGCEHSGLKNIRKGGKSWLDPQE